MNRPATAVKEYNQILHTYLPPALSDIIKAYTQGVFDVQVVEEVLRNYYSCNYQHTTYAENKDDHEVVDEDIKIACIRFRHQYQSSERRLTANIDTVNIMTIAPANPQFEPDDFLAALNCLASSYKHCYVIYANEIVDRADRINHVTINRQSIITIGEVLYLDIGVQWNQET